MAPPAATRDTDPLAETDTVRVDSPVGWPVSELIEVQTATEEAMCTHQLGDTTRAC